MRMGKNLRQMTLGALFTALMAVCAWLTVPFVVPFTMQTFALFAALNLLGWRGTLGSLAAYFLLGAIGLPVFSGFSGGIAHLIGPTGGYMLGFAVSALVYGGVERALGRGRRARITGMLAGLLACYAFGTAWFMLVYTGSPGGVNLAAALSWCVLPYIVPDLIKMALALLLSERIEKAVSLR